MSWLPGLTNMPLTLLITTTCGHNIASFVEQLNLLFTRVIADGNHKLTIELVPSSESLQIKEFPSKHCSVFTHPVHYDSDSADMTVCFKANLICFLPSFYNDGK